MIYTVGRPGGHADHVSGLDLAVKHAIREGSGQPVRVEPTTFGFHRICFEKPGWAVYSVEPKELLDILQQYVDRKAAPATPPPEPGPSAPVPVA